MHYLNSFKQASLLLFIFIWIAECTLSDYKLINIKDLFEHKTLSQLNANAAINGKNNAELNLKENILPLHLLSQSIINKIRNLKGHKYDDNFSTNTDTTNELSTFRKERFSREKKSSSSSSTSSSSTESELVRHLPKQKTVFNKVPLKPGGKYSQSSSDTSYSYSENIELTKKPITSNNKIANMGTNNVFRIVENKAALLRSSCSKGASKVCIKACKSVLKGVCREYKCGSGMKSRFKNECRKNCKKKFGIISSDDEKDTDNDSGDELVLGADHNKNKSEEEPSDKD